MSVQRKRLTQVPLYALIPEAFRSVRPLWLLSGGKMLCIVQGTRPSFPLGKSTAGATFGVSAFTGTEHRELFLTSADWVLVLWGCGNVHQYFMKYAWKR